MYYYKHVNGETISKPDFTVDSAGGPEVYFEGPFVERWWWIEDKQGENMRHFGSDRGLA